MARGRSSAEGQEVYDAVGASIRRARGDRTQRDVAQAAGIKDQTTLSDYELARSRVPLHILPRIAAACDVELVDLLVDANLIDPAQVPVETETVSAISKDPGLNDDGREVLLHVYAFSVRAAAGHLKRPEDMTRDELAKAAQDASDEHQAWVKTLGHAPTEADLERRAQDGQRNNR